MDKKEHKERLERIRRESNRSMSKKDIEKEEFVEWLEKIWGRKDLAEWSRG